jgi:hypothetical protein
MHTIVDTREKLAFWAFPVWLEVDRGRVQCEPFLYVFVNARQTPPTKPGKFVMAKVQSHHSERG